MTTHVPDENGTVVLQSAAGCVMESDDCAVEMRCPNCGREMRYMGKSTFSGTEVREFWCAPCGHGEDADYGTALWRQLSDDPLANEMFAHIAAGLPAVATAKDGVAFLERVRGREEPPLQALARIVESPGADRVLSAVAFFLFNGLGREAGVDELVRRLPPENRGLRTRLAAAMADLRAGEEHARGMFDRAGDAGTVRECVSRLTLYPWRFRFQIFEREARRRLRAQAATGELPIVDEFLRAVEATEPLCRVFTAILAELSREHGEPYAGAAKRHPERRQAP